MASVPATDGVAITGGGIVCSIASSLDAFAAALQAGRSGIARQPAGTLPARGPQVAARIADFSWPQWLEKLAPAEPALWGRARKILNNAPLSARLGAAAAADAFRDAGLGAADRAAGERTGLIVAGSNLSQDYLFENALAVAAGKRPNPKYAVSYSDTNQVGIVSELLGLSGPGSTVGAASASGNAALFHAWHWVRTGVVERCVVLGAATEFSVLELEAFAILGAASLADDPAAACRPFDAGHNGFVWGEAAAAVVLESAGSASARGARVRGRLLGAALHLDARHGPEPDVAAEARAMRAALAAAGFGAEDVDYVNTHGTGSPAGDRAEAAALRDVFHASLAHVRLNATKALVGHCMSSAGIVELLACLMQMQNGFVHGNPNLVQPIDPQLSFVPASAEPARVRVALSNGFGFGGFNTAVVIGAP